MSAITETISITNLRRNSAKALDSAKENGVVLVLRNSSPKAALVDIDRFKELEEIYEEYLDILSFDKHKNDPGIPWKKARKEFI